MGFLLTLFAISAVAALPVIDDDQASPQALPSVRVTGKEDRVNTVQRGKNNAKYGGKGDKSHLGGFTTLDIDGISPGLWKYMITSMNVHSVIDVGCGKGVSSSWFWTHGVDVRCVEGSHDAVVNSLLPPDKVVEHDFSRGAWWPSETYDIAWSVEFLEHVGRQHMANYMPIFERSAYLFLTHSNWGGWHHVEVHQTEWWILKMQAMGFVYSDALTKKVKAQAGLKNLENKIPLAIAAAPPFSNIPKEKRTQGIGYWRAQHLSNTMMVFVNPRVASLPRHAHVFLDDGDTGCYTRKSSRGNYQKCQGADELPPAFRPLPITPEQDATWEKMIAQSLTVAP